MKKMIGWTASWILYYMGDAASKFLDVPDSWKFPQVYYSLVYKIYNSLMNWSSDVQDWYGGSSPWENVKEN